MDILLNIGLVLVLPFVVAWLASKYLFKQSKNAFAWILAVMMLSMFYLLHHHEVSFLGYLDSVLVHFAKFLPAYLLARYIYGRLRPKFKVWLFYVLWAVLWVLNSLLIDSILNVFGIQIWKW